MYFYKVYGLIVATDHYFEELHMLPHTPPSIDLQVYFWTSPSPAIEWEPEPTFRSRQQYDDENGIPHQALYRSINQQHYKLVYRDTIAFTFDKHGSTIHVEAIDAEVKQGSFRAYFLGAGLGYALILRNVPLLHGSVVKINGGGIAFVGRSTAGKSTTAAYLARQGHVVTNDDIVPLCFMDNIQHWGVAPGYLRLRLWSDASTALEQDETDPVVEDIPKYYVKLKDFSTETFPLKTIFILRGRDSKIVEPLIERISPQEALMQLMGHVYYYRFSDDTRKANYFDVIGELTRQVAVYNVTMPHSLQQLNASVTKLLQEHYRSLDTD